MDLGFSFVNNNYMLKTLVLFITIENKKLKFETLLSLPTFSPNAVVQAKQLLLLQFYLQQYKLQLTTLPANDQTANMRNLEKKSLNDTLFQHHIPKLQKGQ